MRSKKLLIDFNSSMESFEFSGPDSFANIMKVNCFLEFKLFIPWGKLWFKLLHSLYFLGHVSWQRTKPVTGKTVVTCRLSWTYSFHKLYYREGIIPLKLEVLDDWKNSGRLSGNKL